MQTAQTAWEKSRSIIRRAQVHDRERFVRSIKEEALEQMVILGERALYYGIHQYLATIMPSGITKALPTNSSHLSRTLGATTVR